MLKGPIPARHQSLSMLIHHHRHARDPSCDKGDSCAVYTSKIPIGRIVGEASFRALPDFLLRSAEGRIDVRMQFKFFF
jgi:hypothetical protein